MCSKCVYSFFKKSTMLKKNLQQKATPHNFTLKFIDQEYISTCRSKDLFEELLEEGQGRSHSPNSALPHLKKQEEEHEHPGCKCSKIDCLKLYCECFAKGRVCNRNCICVGCQNHPQNHNEIYHAQQVANYRNPGYFKGVPAFVPARKCTCKKSSCRKNYCQCYRAGVKCGIQCECVDCHNGNHCRHHPSKDYSNWMEVQSPIEISSIA